MKVYGLIGKQLDHSFSKDYFERKFQRENIVDAKFELFPIEELSLFETLIHSQPHICGLAVTIPYKEQIIQKLDEVDPTAMAIGSVNCIVFNEDRTKGYNTDIIGFEKSLKESCTINIEGALILGEGGASKAIQFVLTNAGIPFAIVSRKPTNQSYMSYDVLNERVLQHHQLIVNCTPLGMGSLIKEKPDIPYQFINESHFLFDLNYNPAETLFLQEGRMRGATVMNGLRMLEIQAEENWLLWNGIKKLG